MEIAGDEKEEVVSEYNVKKDLFMVCHRKKDEEDCKPGNTSVAMASMVMAYGRIWVLELLHAIESVGEGRILYFDTGKAFFGNRKHVSYIEQCS